MQHDHSFDHLCCLALIRRAKPRFVRRRLVDKRIAAAMRSVNSSRGLQYTAGKYIGKYAFVCRDALFGKILHGKLDEHAVRHALLHVGKVVRASWCRFSAVTMPCNRALHDARSSFNKTPFYTPYPFSLFVFIANTVVLVSGR